MSITSLAIPGGWQERRVAVAGRVFRLLMPADPDALLAQLIDSPDAAQRHLADPYWAKLWPAAKPLAEAVLRTMGPMSKVQGPRSDHDFGLGTLDLGLPCLELGCGSGLAGLAALAAGWDVTFSDYVPQAVELALENAARNGFRTAKGLVLDWRSPPRGDQFALLLAADVTYDRTNLVPLLDTLDCLLAPGGQIWLGDAGRGPAAEFLRLAADRGWTVDLFDEHDQPLASPVLGRCQRIVMRR